MIQNGMVNNLLYRMHTHKSMGPDGIHPRVMKELETVLAMPFSITFQQSWLTKEI